MRISFTTNDYCVSEDNGTVYVCLTKNIVAAEDIVIDVTASQHSPFFPVGFARGQLSCLDIYYAGIYSYTMIFNLFCILF